LIGLATNDLQVVSAHQLPNYSQNHLLVSVGNVTSTNTNCLHIHSLVVASIESNLAVDLLFEFIVRVLFDSVPFNDIWVDFMNNLQENLTVTHILEQVVDVNILDFKGVDPQTELSLFTGSSNVVIDETCLVDFFLGDFFKTVSSIKDLSNKNSVDL
jgi:hypothetical protein